jgi:hypothetical protein
MTYNLFDNTFFYCYKNVHEGSGSGIQWPPESGSIIPDHGSVWNSYGSGTLLGVTGNFLNVCLEESKRRLGIIVDWIDTDRDGQVLVHGIH